MLRKTEIGNDHVEDLLGRGVGRAEEIQPSAAEEHHRNTPQLPWLGILQNAENRTSARQGLSQDYENARSIQQFQI